jgi:hypothetical protein
MTDWTISCERSTSNLSSPTPLCAGRPTAIARLDDADLVSQVLFELRTGGPVHGPAHRQLFDDLWLYAWPVLKAFLRNSRMNQVVRRYVPWGVAITPKDLVTLRHSEAERDALAIGVISRAVVAFEKNAILAQKWSPTGRASLRTWFIGMCAMVFPRAYARWSEDRTDRLVTLSRDGRVPDHPEDLNDLVAEMPDPADVASTVLRCGLCWPRPSRRRGTSWGGSLRGTYREIADELQWSVGAVTLRIYRLREHVLRDQQAAFEKWNAA